MLVIDGARGEGGGQILRTSLALSMCLAKPFKIINIRATRKTPGLRPQHLMAVKAAVQVAHAEVEGAELDSQQLSFTPRGIYPGHYDFLIGTAGSTTLVLQTVLPALMLADGPSSLNLQGGTHNPLAPPYPFIARAFVPLLNRMGPRISVMLLRPGFYPKGGGSLQVRIQPASRLRALHVPQRGLIQAIHAEILLSHLPEHIAQRECRILTEGLSLKQASLVIHRDESAFSPGNVVTVTVESEHVSDVFSAIGERGLPAEEVAARVVKAVQDYLRTEVAVGPHLADQLLLPIALAGEGSFLTGQPSLHTRTNIDVIGQFMPVTFSLQEIRPDAWLIALRPQPHHSPSLK